MPRSDRSHGGVVRLMSGLMNVADVVATHARLIPDKLAARDSRRSLTFCEWNERADRLAKGLRSLGLSKGDRVALLAYNCIEWMEMYVALARAGLIAVPVDFRLAGPEIEYIAQSCQARAFIVQHDLVACVDAIRSPLGIPPERWVHFGSGPAPAGWSSYETLIAREFDAMPTVDIETDDVWALMFTSGTTGHPKAAIRTHGATAVMSLVTAIDMDLTPDDTALLVMPMCHANSLFFSFAFAYLGASCVINDSGHFDPENVLKILSSEGVTFTSLVPSHYIAILGLPQETKQAYDVSRVNKLMISSAPARRDTKLAIMEYFSNSQLYELYGSTEAGWVTLLRPSEQLTKLGSIGREWTGSGAIKLLDAHGDEVPVGEIGELFSRTPYAFHGYWQDPEKTAEAFRGEWSSQGDLACRDADGYFWLAGRKSNMIICGGSNIYPAEVENVIGGHPAVRDIGVIGVPDERLGETVCAVVVRHSGSVATEQEILDWCKGRLAEYKLPRSIALIDESDIPRTATGKIQHHVLRKRWTAEGWGVAPDASAVVRGFR
jgi:fatty-acyl-CoA synthase